MRDLYNDEQRLYDALMLKINKLGIQKVEAEDLIDKIDELVELILENMVN